MALSGIASEVWRGKFRAGGWGRDRNVCKCGRSDQVADPPDFYKLPSWSMKL